MASLVLGGERVVLVSDPVATRSIVQDNADVWVKEGTAFFPGSALAGNGLLVSDGDVWRRQRRLANPAFRQAAARSFCFRTFLQCGFHLWRTRRSGRPRRVPSFLDCSCLFQRFCS